MLSGQDWTLGALTGEFREISFPIFPIIVFDISVLKGFRRV